VKGDTGGSVDPASYQGKCVFFLSPFAIGLYQKAGRGQVRRPQPAARRGSFPVPELLWGGNPVCVRQPSQLGALPALDSVEPEAQCRPRPQDKVFAGSKVHVAVVLSFNGLSRKAYNVLLVHYE